MNFSKLLLSVFSSGMLAAVVVLLSGFSSQVNAAPTNCRCVRSQAKNPKVKRPCYRAKVRARKSAVQVNTSKSAPNNAINNNATNSVTVNVSNTVVVPSAGNSSSAVHGTNSSNVPTKNIRETGASSSTDVRPMAKPSVSRPSSNTSGINVSLDVGGVFNTSTGNVTPEIGLSVKTSEAIRLRGYAGIGNTGMSITPARAAVTRQEVSSYTPAKLSITAANQDRSVFSWEDSHGRIQNTVKDKVYNQHEIEAKKAWIVANGGKYYGVYTLKACTSQKASSAVTQYKTVEVSKATQEVRQALSGITYGGEVGVTLGNSPLELTAGAKVAGSTVIPTVGANLEMKGRDAFASVGVRHGLSEGAGTDMRAAVGLNF